MKLAGVKSDDEYEDRRDGSSQDEAKQFLM